MTDEPEELPPTMIGTPPSASQVPLDPGLHALDFSRRYANELDYHAGQVMTELGIPENRIGDSDRTYGIRHAAFHPHRKEGGTVSAKGQIILDSGVMNPEQLTPIHGESVGKIWAKSDLKSRMQAIVAHELAEHQHDSHETALKVAPDTALPIGEGARRILRAMSK